MKPKRLCGAASRVHFSLVNTFSKRSLPGVKLSSATTAWYKSMLKNYVIPELQKRNVISGDFTTSRHMCWSNVTTTLWWENHIPSLCSFVATMIPQPHSDGFLFLWLPVYAWFMGRIKGFKENIKNISLFNKILRKVLHP